MFDPVTSSANFKSPILWVDLAISILVIAAFCYIYISISKRKQALIYAPIFSVVSVAAWFFGLTFLWALTLAVMVSTITVVLIQNQNDVHDLVNTLFRKKRKFNAEKVYDRHAICQKISLAVENLSRTKTGALITFEKGVKLNEVVKTGTILHAPVTPELLVTIFYPGTRLHDGAVVIRRDEILAASVYYTPTTKPLTGKFGSRHRAAIGISELTDSVTVIVSEETGRISIAYGGELISVQQDNFLRTLEDYVFSEDATNKKVGE